MKNQFVSYEIALKLKELGFDESCLAYYTTGTDVTLDKDGNPTNFVLLSAKLRGELVGHGSVKNNLFKWLSEHDRTSGELYTLSRSITAPLWQQVIDWFREKHKLLIDSPKLDEWNYGKWAVKITSLDKSIILEEYVNQPYWIIYRCFNSYEAAREQAILRAIEIIENKPLTKKEFIKQVQENKSEFNPNENGYDLFKHRGIKN